LREGWGTTLLLIAMVVACASIFARADWTSGLDVVLWTGLGGLLVGLLFGWSVFSSSLSHFLETVYGLAWLGFLLGRRLPGEMTWGERIIELVSHLGRWIQIVMEGGPGEDALIFVMSLGVLFWFLGYNAAWNTYRRTRPWWAVVPLGIAGLVAVYYYYGSEPLVRYLVLYLFLSLLYVARLHIIEKEQTWREQQVAYSSELPMRVFQASVLITVVVLALAWALPTAAAVPKLAATWQRVSTPWRTVRDEWQRLFSTVRGPQVRSVTEPFGPSLSLGGEQSVEDVLVMDVEAPREGRYYWRGAIYDTYTGSRWQASENETIPLAPDRPIRGIEQSALRHPVTQTVTSYGSTRHVLVAASQLVMLDREAEAYVDPSEDTPVDFFRVLSVLPLVTGDTYTAYSYVSDADAPSLRRAGTDYPEWILDRYLTLPVALPERVRLLAEETTLDASNAYDKAIAIQQYLRQNITYDLQPPSRPDDQDYVDFLLFDSQRDYCNGYATAMVVLARSVGIPARLAVGYGQGEYDEERAVFRVREKNAHSWPELYFPSYGWLEFEPTASEEPYVRPDPPEDEAAAEDVPRGAGQDISEEEGVFLPPGFDYPAEWDFDGADMRRGMPLWPWALGLALVALAATGWWSIENWGFRGLSLVERAYARLLRLGGWLGRPFYVSDTPCEWGRDVGHLVPEAETYVNRIVDLYVRARFARGETEVDEANSLWKLARPGLWRGWARRLIPRLRNR
jgi:transglutaminase-like putative cysteine protease